jgi:hypothetical protein
MRRRASSVRDVKLRLGRKRSEPPAPFIVGVGRSGTTLLRMMLDAHPELAIPPETHFIPQVARRLKGGFDRERFVQLVSAHRRWGDFHIDAAELRARLEERGIDQTGDALRAFYRHYAERHGKTRFGDKTPKYLTKMRPIAAVLPEATFVHLVRDGRDVALSKSDRSGRPAAESARTWRRRIERARKQARRIDRYVEMRYEALVEDPEPHLRQICELIRLDYDPVMLTYHERAGERLAELGDAQRGGDDVRPAAGRRAAHAMTTRPPEASRIARWRTEMPASDREAFEAEAGELLSELGYPVGSTA